jgi:TolB-like protein
MVNSGMVKVVANPEERADVRNERKDQQYNATPETRTKMAQELGAKYMLQGTLQAIEDAEGRDKVVFYQVDATVIDLETNVKIWTGQHKIKKYVERPRIRM